MNIEEQFNIIAEEYDSNRKKFIPCFDDFYEKATDFVVSNISIPKKILDLGAGTGLLSYFWYKHFPNSEYLLVDIAEEMLKIAGKRFAGIKNIECRISDYSETFPQENYDCIISALSIHHLENEKKAELFKRIYDNLPQKGVFVNYDQFCSDSDDINSWLDLYWKNQLENSGLSEKDLALWKKRRLLDRECSVDFEIGFLKHSGFENVQCIYQNQKFSVIVAIK